MAFLKFQDAEDPGGRQLSWCRSDLDGMPFRGQALPLRSEEFDEFTETVADAYAKTFDMSDPKQAREYQKVLEGIVAPWYQLLFRSHHWAERPDGSVFMTVYIEWSIPHRELSSRFANAVDAPIINNLGANGNGLPHHH